MSMCINSSQPHSAVPCLQGAGWIHNIGSSGKQNPIYTLALKYGFSTAVTSEKPQLPLLSF